MKAKLLVIAGAALALALAVPVFAAESHVEASCETGSAGSETSATGDVSLGLQSASAGRLTLKAAAAAVSADSPGPHRYCDALSRFTNAVTVESGTTGLSAGAPVTLRLSVTMNGALGASQLTSDQSFLGSALRNASIHATVPGRVVCETEDGREHCGPAELATFNAHTMFKVEGDTPNPPYPGEARDYLEWGWALAGNHDAGVGDSGTRSLQTCAWPGQFPCLFVDQPPPDPDYAGTHTVVLDALVGDRIELSGTLDVLAQAIWGSAHVDFSGQGLFLKAELTPAAGFEGLRLVKDVAPPADQPPAPPSDTQPPTLVVPAGVTANATGPSGAVVTYTVTATDNVPAGLTSTCSPASAMTFPIGTTTVTCTATDAAGNTATKTFAATVVGASGQITQLTGKTLQFLDRPVLAPAFRVTLRATLDAAVAGRKAVACVGLQVYALAVRISGPAFTGAERNELLADASRIRAVLGCA